MIENLSDNKSHNFLNYQFNKHPFEELKVIPITTNKQCLFVLDRKNMQVNFSIGVTNMLGYSVDEFNMGAISNKIHPDDKLLVNRIIKASVSLASKTNIKKGVTFLTKSFRIQKSDGTYIKVMSQSSPFQVDEKDKLISYFTMLTDISFMNASNTVKWEFISDEKSAFFIKKKIYNEFFDLFSKRELEIVSLLITACTTKQIAAKLHLSPHTVVSHRKNIFKKTNAHCVKELVSFVEKNGII